MGSGQRITGTSLQAPHTKASPGLSWEGTHSRAAATDFLQDGPTDGARRPVSLPQNPCRTPWCAQTPVWGFTLLRGHGPLSPRTTTENRGSQRPRLPPITHGAPGDLAAGPRPPQGPRGWRTGPPVPQTAAGPHPGGLRSRLCSTGPPDPAARLLEAVLVNYSFPPGANSQSCSKALII